MTSRSAYVDVLIIGTGPAGSMLATSLSRNGIRYRIIDKRDGVLLAGQADGLNQRTQEIMQSLKLTHIISSESGQAYHTVRWLPGDDGGLKRLGETNLAVDAFSEFQLQTMKQGRVERMLQDNAKLYNGNEVDRAVLPVSLSVDEAQVDGDKAYPVKVVLQHLKEDEAWVSQVKAHVKGQDHAPNDGLYRSNIGPTNHTEELIKKVAGRKETEEVVHARYVVGCDGAWSWTREQLGIKMVGAKSDVIWGVLDIIPITDYPDVRDIGAIQSHYGSILWIPREQGLVRLYTQLQEVKPGKDGTVDRSKITPDQIFEQARKILQPYKIEYRYCDWWTAYQVGQRMGEAYHDPKHRVFLAGDAVHTHSPKEGLGMNTSMQDTFNLGWKLAAVLNEESPRSILESYQPERRPVAQQLIDLDRAVSAAYAGQPNGIDLYTAYEKQAEFLTGFAIQYSPSALISDKGTKGTAGDINGDVSKVVKDGKPNGIANRHGTETKRGPASSIPEPLNIGLPKSSGPGCISSLARGLSIGRRMPPCKVLQHTGQMTNSLLKLAQFDGRWRLFVFAGKVQNPPQLNRVNKLGAALADPKTGILHLKHTLHLPLAVPFPYALGSEAGRNVQATQREVPLIDIITVHASKFGETELADFHDVFWPMDEVLGRAYDKIHHSQDVYGHLGIPAETGCLVLLRPDQHIAWIGDIDDAAGLRGFAEGCMLL